MRRFISSMAAVVLMFSLFSTAVFAAESPPVSEDKEVAIGSDGGSDLSGLPTLSTQTAETTTDLMPSIDRSDRTVSDGLYVDVYAPAGWDSDYIPEFTLELWSAQDNKLISSATGNSQNFDKDSHRYRLTFNHPGYRLGDRLALVLKKADGVIEHLDFSEEVPASDGTSTRSDYDVSVGTHFPFTIRSFDYMEGEHDEKTIRDVIGTKLHPLGATMQTNSNRIGLLLKDASGTLLKNVPVEIKLLEGKGMLSLTSDDGGMIWIDRSKLTWKFLVSSAGRVVSDGVNGKAEISLPVAAISGTADSAVVIPIVFEKEQFNPSSSVNVHVQTNSRTDLSQAWSDVDVTLTPSEGVTSTYPLNLSSISIEGVVDGKYKVTVDGKYAAAKLNSDTLTVTGGKASLQIDLTPKYTLEISKGGKPYNFSIINVAAVVDQVLQGEKPESFAVTPGESYMVKDNDTGEVMTVAIDENAPITRVVLGAGIATGAGASSPQTGDRSPFLWTAFILCAGLLIIGAVILFRNRQRTNSALTKSSLSIVLVLTLVASSFSFLAPSGVQAASSEANVGGTPPATGGSYSSTPAGAFQTSDSVAVLQVGFLIDDQQTLTTDATASDMQDGFNFDNEPLMFYMAPNKVSHDLFTKPGSGVITFERSGSGSKVKTLYGSNPLYPGSASGGTHADLLKRTLPYVDQNVDNITITENFFEKLVARALYQMAPGNSNRSLSGVDTNQVVGESFRKLLTDYVADQNNASLNELDKMDAQIVASLMFKGYLNLIEDRGILTGQAYSDFEARMREAFSENKLILSLQTVVGISVRDNRSALDREYAFMPMKNAVDWYLWVRQTARPTDQALQKLTALRQAEAVALGGASSADDGNRSPYKENGNIPYSFRSYARDSYVKTLQPSSKSVPVSADYKVNPFGGWGYQPWGYGSGIGTNNNRPAIDAELNVTVVDQNGTPTGVSFTEPVKGWSEDSKRILWDVFKGDKNEQTIRGSMSVEHDGKTYDLLSDSKARFSLVDKKDQENINKSSLTIKATGKDGFIPIPASAQTSQWEIYFEWDIPAADKLHAYLGGDGELVPSVDNKYKNEGKSAYSDAKLTLFVKALVDSPTPIASTFNVPEWRLSQYWDDISGSNVNKARFSLSLPSQTFLNPELSPSGNTPFRLLDPDLSGANWAMSKAKLINDTPIRPVTPYSPSASFNLAGDLLAIRDNGSVSNIKLASWINNFSLFNGRITTASSGAAENKPTVAKQFLFQYGVKSPSDLYQYSETRYSCNLYGCTPYRWSDSVTPSYRTADYDTKVTFQRYVPKDSKALPSFSVQSQSDNGLFWQTKQSEKTFKVNPEVLYAYSDTAGNTSVAFAAGDKLREIKPVSYSMVQFDKVKVSPEVTGVSAATEAGAKQLAASLGANGKQVIYKDSAVTISGKSDGDLKIRNFALDISSSALNKAWNPSGTYNPDEINQSFLNQYGTKGDDDKWSIPLSVDGRLKIGGKEFGAVTSNVAATEASTSQVVHTLEIRGGKLVGLDGNRSLGSLDADLKAALVNMKILSDDNVFSTFEKNGGAALSESLVATLGNALRGTNDLRVGQGWYSEDTTQLVVREYVTTFALPLVTYTDKVPLEIDGLQVPSDKSQFFSVGKQGFVTMDFKLANRNEVHMKADSSTGEFAEKGVNFVTTNVSVLDTFGSVW